jgi:hypothetical protein
LTDTLTGLVGTALGMQRSLLELASIDLEKELQWAHGPLPAGAADCVGAQEDRRCLSSGWLGRASTGSDRRRDTSHGASQQR